VKPGRKETTMSKSPARERTPSTPAWLTAARAFYGGALEVSSPDELAVTMADWTEMSEAERSFVQTHLLYLDLLAQRGTQRMLAALRRTLGELGEEALELLDDLGLDDEDGEDEEQEGDEDLGLEYLGEIETAEPEVEQAPKRRLELVRDEPEGEPSEGGDATDPEAS